MAAGPIDIRVRTGRERDHGPEGRARLERAVDAAHSLCELLWQELREEARAPLAGVPSPRSAKLAARLADIASSVALLADAGDDDATSDRGEAGRAQAACSTATAARPSVVLVDEYEERACAPPAQTAHRTLADAAQDGAAGRPAWLRLIENALARFEQDDIPFAVLLVEVLDAAGMAGADDRVGPTLARALDAIAPASIARESSGRYWLLLPHADRVGARIVADRLAHAAHGANASAAGADAAGRYFAALSARGSRADIVRDTASLRLAVGTAACPENGRAVAALVAEAHIELAEEGPSSRPLETFDERQVWR